MASSKFVDPPQQVKDQLEQLLLLRYNNLGENGNRNITYALGKYPVKYTARVTYYCTNTSSVALFDYQENKGKREYDWYCTHDWND